MGERGKERVPKGERKAEQGRAESRRPPPPPLLICLSLALFGERERRKSERERGGGNQGTTPASQPSVFLSWGRQRTSKGGRELGRQVLGIEFRVKGWFNV